MFTLGFIKIAVSDEWKIKMMAAGVKARGGASNPGPLMQTIVKKRETDQLLPGGPVGQLKKVFDKLYVKKLKAAYPKEKK